MTIPSPPAGVKIKLVGRQFLDLLPTAEKIRFILDEVEAGQVLVLEKGLTAREEAQLIEATMAEIDHDRFKGIELQSYGAEEAAKGRRPRGSFWKVAHRERPKMVVVGPANVLRGVTKDQNSLQALLFPPAGAGA